MRIGEWTFSDFPTAYDERAYDGPREKMRQKAEMSKDVSMLLQAGGVAYPGISDIDFLVLFDEGAHEFFLSPEPRYAAADRYLMKHNPLLMSERFYRDYFYLDPLLRFVESGQRVIFKRKDLSIVPLNVSSSEQALLDIHFCFELLQMRLLDVRHTLRKELQVRHALISLKSIEYLLRVVQTHAMDTRTRLSPASYTFGERLDTLNKEWFGLPPEEACRRLLALYEESLDLAFTIAFVFNDFLAPLVQSRPRKQYGIAEVRGLPPGVYTSSFALSLVFSDVIDSPALALRQTLRLSHEYNIPLLTRRRIVWAPIVTLPLNLSLMVLTFAAQKGILSDALRHATRSTQEELPALSSPALAHRIELINQLTHAYVVHRSPRGEGKGYLFGNNIFQFPLDTWTLRRALATSLLRRSFLRRVRTLL